MFRMIIDLQEIKVMNYHNLYNFFDQGMDHQSFLGQVNFLKLSKTLKIYFMNAYMAGSEFCKSNTCFLSQQSILNICIDILIYL